MSKLGMNRITEDSGETNLQGFLQVMSIPESPVRFWIISMMLVLIGLASLKLR